jgi:hypothetical protein
MFESFDAGPYWRIVLEPEPEGVYVLVYETERSEVPDRDTLQDDFAMAKLACREDFGTTDESWHDYFGPKVMG